MISSEQILNQIEKQIKLAKMDADGQSAREALAAIRALCDVVLDSPKARHSINIPIVSQPIDTAVLSTKAAPLKEDDANGESLFDF